VSTLGGRGRIGRGGLFGGGIGGFVLLIVIVIAVVKALTPAPKPPACPGGSPCGAPPVTPVEVTQVQLWKSSSLEFELDFDPRLWTISSQSATQVILTSNEPGSPFFVWFAGVPAEQATPAELRDQLESALAEKVLGLQEDTSAPILGPAIGYVGGVGARYVGQVDSPQGPGEQIDISIMAATNGTITTAVAVVTDHGATREAYGQADPIVNTLEWPGGAG
jgi:uncharacterized membrane protein